MNRIVPLFCSLLFILSIAAFPGSAGAASRNSINLGGLGLVGPDLTAYALQVEYERLLGNGVSLFGRTGFLNYSYDDDIYEEDGDGPGLDIGVRKYFGRDEMKGFYIGGSLGIWKVDWTFTDHSYSTSSPWFSGKGDSTALKLDLEIGGRIPLGSSPLAIRPSFHVGHYFDLDESCSSTSVPGADCGADSELGFYAVLGLAVGISF
jgi:hypothetical protein